MTDKYDTEYLEPGDTFEGGPIEQSYFISAVLGAGGTVEILGNNVKITSLPGKTKAEVSEKPVEKAPEPVKAVEEVKEEPKQEEAKEEEAPKPVPKPAAPKPGPKPKVVAKEDSSESKEED